MSASVQLIKYDSMCRAISAAHKVDEVKDIRDKTLALEAYFKQAKNTDAERKACEIRLRAERKAGALLKKMEKATGGEHGGRKSKDGRRARPSNRGQTLNDLGISKDQSSRWQQLADVPDDEFEAALADPKKPSTSGILNGTKKPQKQMDPKALWLWGRLRDFEREGVLQGEPHEFMDEMTEAMRADVCRLAPLVADWLGGLTE